MVMRLPEAQRQATQLAAVLIETPNGRVPLSQLARIEDGDGPNQISRENARRRITLTRYSDYSGCMPLILRF